MITVSELLYNCSIESGCNIYSGDRARIDFEMNYNNVEYLIRNPNKLKRIIPDATISEEDPRSYHYNRKCIKKYHDKDGKQYASLELNLFNNSKNGCKCYAVFNPNRCFHSEEFMKDLYKILSLADSYTIHIIDVAVDMPIEKYFVNLMKDRRSKLEYIASKDNTTEYLGKNRNKVGHVKLYDKQKESKLTYSLTRCEITLGNPLKDGWIQKVSLSLPKVIIRSNECIEVNLDSSLNDTEKVLVETLRDNYEKVKYFQKLGYKMKKKLAPYVFTDDKEFEFDLQAIADVADKAVKAISFDFATIRNDYFINKNPINLC